MSHKLTLAWFSAVFALAPAAFSQTSSFSPDAWVLGTSRVTTFLGRDALMGIATLKGVEFSDGVIEFDIGFASDRIRSYAGVNFRVSDGGNWERFYIRPHRSAMYDDVLQYVPAFHGVDSWQLYSGPGFTAPAVIPTKQWIHVRLEVAGSQAQVFVGDSNRPALVIPVLQHGASKGSISLTSPMDGTAYFSNFSIKTGTKPDLGVPPLTEVSPGCIREWQLSKMLPATTTRCDAYPVGDLGWKDVKAADNGLLDVSRWYARSGEPDLVYLRTVLRTDNARTMKLDFGYSDTATLFLNGKPVFTGESAYRSRESSFLGVVGFNDSVYLPLQQGDNELVVSLAERMGGWGFVARDGDAEYLASGVTKLWESGRKFAMPETVAYDSTRKTLYVSNYDGVHVSVDAGSQCISSISLNGTGLAPKWLEGVRNPTGMVVVGDKLWIVEPRSLVCADISTQTIEHRYDLQGAMTLNDVAAADDGSLYLTDSARGAIFRFADGKAVVWASGPEFTRPNGIRIRKAKLYVGTNADGCLKEVDLISKNVKVIANLGQGIIDGIRLISNGDLLVSHNEGRLYRIRLDGTVTKLLDLTNRGVNIANFDFVEAQNMVVIPTFTDNRVIAYRIPPNP